MLSHKQAHKREPHRSFPLSLLRTRALVFALLTTAPISCQGTARSPIKPQVTKDRTLMCLLFHHHIKPVISGEGTRCIISKSAMPLLSQQSSNLTLYLSGVAITQRRTLKQHKAEREMPTREHGLHIWMVPKMFPE